MNSHRWALQEASGTSVADELGAIDGAVDGTVSLGAVGPGGNYPRAIDLAGGSVAPITLDQTITLSRKHDWSINFWAKQDDANLEGMILGDRESPVSFLWLSSTFGGLIVRPAHSVTMTGTNNGLDVVFPLSVATRTKWSEYELTYNADEAGPTLILSVDGAVVATEAAPDGMEMRINTLGGGHPNGSYSLNGKLAGVELTGTEIDYAQPDKIVLVLGQSNAAGRFDNHQAYSHPTQFASVFSDGQWGELFDEGIYGTVWPLLATRWLADRNESVGFIYAAVGSTGLVDTPDWSAGGATYEAAIAIVEASGVDRVDAVLWFQGERDANAGVTRADYLAAMQSLIERLHEDVPGRPPLICGQISSVAGGMSDQIRNAQSDAWDFEHIYAGPVTYDLGPLADALHFTTDAEASVLADRWWAAIDEALFDGVEGTPPRLISAVADETSVTLTYDRDLETATDYGASTWNFTDHDEDISVVAAEQTDTRIVELSLASIPATSVKTVTLAAGISGQGQTVPRGLGGQPALPETFSVSVPAQQSSTTANIRALLSMHPIRRTISVV